MAAVEGIYRGMPYARMNYIYDRYRQYVQVLAETVANGVVERVYEWGYELINQ